MITLTEGFDKKARPSRFICRWIIYRYLWMQWEGSLDSFEMLMSGGYFNLHINPCNRKLLQDLLAYGPI